MCGKTNKACKDPNCQTGGGPVMAKGGALRPKPTSPSSSA